MPTLPSDPLLTYREFEQIRRARAAGAASVECSLDLQRSRSTILLGERDWRWGGRGFPYPDRLKERTIYHWTGRGFEPVARYGSSLVKLVPTEWGPPTFEIDGIKMLPTASVSPYADAQRKVELVRPNGKTVLDTCGGLGYFAAWCLEREAAAITSFEKNADVLWLRELNPWSPRPAPRLRLLHADVLIGIAGLPDGSIDSCLHDPPRFGTAGDLYSLAFYSELARVMKRRGRLFHYTGTPNKLTSGRDVPGEVAIRLRSVGFRTERNGDGLLAVKS